MSDLSSNHIAGIFVLAIFFLLFFAALPKGTFRRRRASLQDRLWSRVAEKPISRRLR